MKRDPFSIFNVNEFKKWMEESSKNEPQNDGQSLIGANVIPKVSFKKLKTVSEALENEKAIMEFHKNGGIILEEEDEGVLTIKTDKGHIKIKKSYIKIN